MISFVQDLKDGTCPRIFQKSLSEDSIIKKRRIFKGVRTAFVAPETDAAVITKRNRKGDKESPVMCFNFLEEHRLP